MNQDEIWKNIIQKLFKEFVEFFIPDLYPEINFDKGYEFLDKELNKILPKSKTKNRRADKLIKVFLKNGKEQWVLIHTEIQGYDDDEFAERMFASFYRIYDEYKKKIIALAVFTDGDANFKPNKFEYNFYQTELTYKYRTFKAVEQDENKLLKNANPFAVVILATKYLIESKNKEDIKLKFKVKLAELLLQRNYNRNEIIEVFNFIDVLLELKNENNRNIYYEEVSKMTKTKNKEIIGDFQKMAMKEGGLKKQTEIAKKMKKNNEPIEKIIDYTGLSKTAIEKL
jgi:hypothetical protein